MHVSTRTRPSSDAEDDLLASCELEYVSACLTKRVPPPGYKKEKEYKQPSVTYKGAQLQPHSHERTKIANCVDVTLRMLRLGTALLTP